VQHIVDRAFLDDRAMVHHGHAVGDVGDDAISWLMNRLGDTQLVAQIAQQVQHGGLHGETSSADTASSQHRNRGREASARAMPTRCFSPPESWCG